MYKQSEIESLSAQFYLWGLASSQECALDRDRAIARFLARYPKKGRPQDFDTSNVLDYRDARLAEGRAAYTVNNEVIAIRSFWRWMIEVKQLPLYLLAPFKPITRPPYRGEELSLADLDKILGVVHDPRARQAILAIVGGTPIKKAAEAAGMDQYVVQAHVRGAAKTLGIGWLNLRRLRRSVRAAVLARGIENYLGPRPEGSQPPPPASQAA